LRAAVTVSSHRAIVVGRVCADRHSRCELDRSAGRARAGLSGAKASTSINMWPPWPGESCASVFRVTQIAERLVRRTAPGHDYHSSYMPRCPCGQTRPKALSRPLCIGSLLSSAPRWRLVDGIRRHVERRIHSPAPRSARPELRHEARAQRSGPVDPPIPLGERRRGRGVVGDRHEVRHPSAIVVRENGIVGVR